ncbi:MAG: inositol monophosphatase [Kineosporiaceae bacterium]|nr:inositol monophosphatase [Kineosporiaceae bacterium]MBK7625171.1 inositol monophosphatase [Kineosporiaceae bacterium]MBK8076449.1 inositol monophosphatase [Kineosporiaceae bacterium]
MSDPTEDTSSGPLPRTVDPGAFDEASRRALLHVAEQAARAAGILVEQGRRAAPVTVEATKSSPTDVVTAMDRAAEQLISEMVQQARPDDALFGEEAGGVAGRTGHSSGLTWVIDPIDGTVNYLYGLPAYAVSVAVVTGDPRRPGGWQALAGCVHNPASGETWTAIAGHGAWLDGCRLPTRSAPPLDAALVGTGFGYRPERRREQAEVVSALLPLVRDIRRIGSASLDLCAVATGRLDAFYERGLNVWDIAAGQLVVTETGGLVLGPGGGPPSPDLVVVGPAPLAETLRGLVEQM